MPNSHAVDGQGHAGGHCGHSHLGVAPLLFLQVLYGRLFFTSSILMAGFWLAVVPLLIVAYYCAYVVAFRGQRTRVGGTAVVGDGDPVPGDRVHLRQQHEPDAPTERSSSSTAPTAAACS